MSELCCLEDFQVLSFTCVPVCYVPPDPCLRCPAASLAALGGFKRPQMFQPFTVILAQVSSTSNPQTQSNVVRESIGPVKNGNCGLRGAQSPPFRHKGR